jgi:non-specific serine/threonine protein kinase
VRILGASVIGRTLSHYKIVAKIGQGGMGEVYLAEDLNLKRRVAVKVLPDAMASDEQRLARFQREAETVAALNHPGIVTIYSIERHEEHRFITMELVEGTSLDRSIPHSGLTPTEILDIGVPLADALAAAHAHGVIHRDLKPANVMVSEEGRVKVLDFGLAKLTAVEHEPGEARATALETEAQTLTREGGVVGTAPYMSPEQLAGREIDHRSDLFSLGVVLYELATGALPFEGSSAAELASAILRDPPPPVEKRNASLPPRLGQIIHRCLEKDPQRRFHSAIEVRDQLEGLRRELDSGEPSAAATSGAAPARKGGATSPGQAPVRKPDPGRRRLALFAALVVVIVLAWWLTSRREAPSDEPASAAARPRSVAVLPFADLSPERDQEHFTDGMTEEIIQALARIEGLSVPSRSATFALKGKEVDLAQIGEALAVDAVVEGSVRKAGDQLRIAAQLVELDSGFELWSRSYGRRLEDVFALQDEIARSIAAALEVTLAPAAAAVEQAGTTSVEAYDYYLRGLEFYYKQTREGFEFSCQMFARAAEADPEYALAYNGLARCHGVLYDVYGLGEEHLEAVDRASRTALELAPDLAESHMARGDYFALTEEVEEAEREFETAIALDPGLSKAYFAYGNFLFKHGRLEETAEMWEKASELDPDDLRPIRVLPQVYRSLGWEAQLQASTLRRVESAERRLKLNPDDQATRLAGAISLLDLGEEERAFEWAARVLESGTDDALILYNTACFYSLAGRIDEAIASLERAYGEGDREADWWRQDSDLDPVRDDPRFQALLAKMDAAE